MLHLWFESNQLYITSFYLFNLCLINNVIFLILEFLDVLCVPIAPPQQTKMGPQHRLDIYVGFDSPSIIRHSKPFIDDFFLDCQFKETVFPLLWEEKVKD